QGAGFLNSLGAVRLAQFYKNAHTGDHVPTQKVWSKQIIWGSHRLTGGFIKPDANAWANGIVWGSARTQVSIGDNIVWGSMTLGDNIVWGTSADDDVTWGSSPDAAPVDPSTVDQATEPAPNVAVEFGDPALIVAPDPTVPPDPTAISPDPTSTPVT